MKRWSFCHSQKFIPEISQQFLLAKVSAALPYNFLFFFFNLFVNLRLLQVLKLVLILVLQKNKLNKFC